MKLKDAVDITLFGMGPDLPVGCRRVIGRGAARSAFVVGFLSALLLCAAGVAVTSWLSGTLRGADPSRLYLSQDRWNIVNYLVLCPLYVGLSAALVVTVVRGFEPLARLGAELRCRSPHSSRLPFTLAPVLVFGVAAAMTVQYIKESLDPTIYPKVGWWVESVSPSGVRIPGLVGTYYGLLNFSLLCACLLALLAFLTIGGAAFSVARGVSQQPSVDSVDWGRVQRTAVPFIKSYVLAKLLVATLMANAFAWKFQRPHGSINIVVLGALLSTVGVGFVSLPRHAIEYAWFKLRLRRARANGHTGPVEVEDMREHALRILVNVLDFALIGGFSGTFFSGL